MNDLFAVHKLNKQGLEKAAKIAQCFDGLLEDLTGIVPEVNREMSLVATHLETACFFAKKAMAKNAENQSTE